MQSGVDVKVDASCTLVRLYKKCVVCNVARGFPVTGISLLLADFALISAV